MKYIIPKVGALLTVALVFWTAGPALAEVRTITATGEYRMGDNDTRTDAKRLALLDAKRLALEQAGVYIESITEVKNFDLSKDEVRAYTAGIVEVTEQTTRTVMEGDTTIVRVNVTAKIDPVVVIRQVDALRQAQDLKGKLIEARFHAWNLQQELEAKTRELAAAKSRTKIEEIAQQRKALIARVESDELATRAGRALVEAWKHKSVVENPLVDVQKYARELLDRALRLDPENPWAHSRMCALLFSEGRYQESVESCRAVVILEPDSAWAHVDLGLSLDLSEDRAGALKEYSIAIQKDPNFAHAYHSLGRLLAHDATMDHSLPQEEKQRVYDYAVTLVRKAIYLEPSYAMSYVSLGRMLGWDKGDIEGGLAEIRTAVRLDPQLPDAQIVLGRLLLKVGDREGAIAAFRVAAQSRSFALDAHRVLANMLHESDSIEEAVAEYRELIRLDLLLDPASSWAANDSMQFGRFYESKGLLEEATQQYRAAFKLSDYSFYAYFLIQALAKSGKKPEASRVLREFLKRHPDDEQSLRRDLKADGLQELDRK